MDGTDRASCQVKNPSALTSLHVEILSQILMLVEGSDIPAVALTCKAFYSVIMTRQFWYDRIHRLCKEHLVSPPEEELEDYTIPELAQWTFQRIKVRCTLSRKLRLRSCDTKSSFTSRNMKLVPGGRWLLVPHRDLRVWFFDLDRNTLEQQLLFDPRCVHSNMSNYSTLGYHMWIDHKASRLSFRYAICLLDCRDGANGLQFSRVQIYQVNLTGHGASATLVAQIIATFRTLEQIPVLLYTFNDRYFVQGRVSSSDRINVEIYDYSRALGYLDYPLIECHTFSLGKYSKVMEFINEDVLAVYCWTPHLLHIFNIESPTSIVRLHTINLHPGWTARSRTCWTPEASVMTRIEGHYGKEGHQIVPIYGLVIPHNNSISPWTIKLGEFKQRFCTSIRMGIFISMTCDPDDSISHIGHEWDLMSQDSNLTHTSLLEHDVDEPQTLVAFDEDTGRSVHRGHDKINVFDIVMAG